jgi:hypothetical protein
MSRYNSVTTIKHELVGYCKHRHTVDSFGTSQSGQHWLSIDRA